MKHSHHHGLTKITIAGAVTVILAVAVLAFMHTPRMGRVVHVDCTPLGQGWQSFAHPKTSLAFCYKTAWGTPKFQQSKIDKQYGIGTAYYINFGTSAAPMFSYETLDYNYTGPTDGGELINWKKLDITKSATKLASLFKNFNPKVKKMTIAGKDALRVETNFIDPLSEERMKLLLHFIPKVTIDGHEYNVQVTSPLEAAKDVDKMVGTIRF